MTRDDGFDVMDVSTAIVHDPKFRKLQRYAPDHAGDAFTAYVAVMAESWKAGRRVNLDDAWPVFLPYNDAASQALIHVGLLDGRGFIPPKTWRGWFDQARERRQKARERWARHNANRTGNTALEPRGSDAATAASVRTSVNDRPSVRTQRVNEAVEDNGARAFRLVDPSGRPA